MNKDDFDAIQERVAKETLKRRESLSEEDLAKDDTIVRIQNELKEAGILFWLVVEEKDLTGQVDVYNLKDGLNPIWNHDGSTADASIDFLRIHNSALSFAAYNRIYKSGQYLLGRGKIEEFGPEHVVEQFFHEADVYLEYLKAIAPDDPTT